MSKISELVGKIVPIHKNEFPKFLWMCLMMVLIVYIHNILKISKDALIISHLGTETISAIKLWIVIPMSMLFTLVYIKISNNLTRSALFHILTWFFIGYFVLFAFVLYPNRSVFAMDPSLLIAKAPAFSHILKALGNWHYSLFYLFSEMWVTMMLSISFWQIANHLTSLSESKRFYPMIGFMAQFGMLFASLLSKSFIAHNNDWQPTLNNLTISLIIAAVFLSISFVGLSKNVGNDVMNSHLNKGEVRKKKPKISLAESLKYIVSSKPILLITTLLVSYNISINLLEGIWKKSIEVYFSSNANHIQSFMSDVVFWVAIFTIVAAVACIFMIRYCKWTISALTTPVFTLATGAIFFLFVMFGSLTATVASSLYMAVLWGAVNNVFARSTKHTLFDATKEMAYIPLDDELKTKGKAAAEMIGMRVGGKGTGAFIQQVLLMFFAGSTLLDLVPIISGIFLVIIICWVFATIALNRELSGKLDAVNAEETSH